MGMDLMGRGGLSINWKGWHAVLTIAHEFGWQPEGTEQPDGWSGEVWDGDYFSNDLQYVTDSDARSMATALEKAIGALKTGAPVEEEQRAVLEGVDVRLLVNFTNYAWGGGFTIG